MSEPSSALSSYWFGLPAWLRGLVRAGERVGGISWAPPAILVVAQWAAVAVFAAHAQRNGWLFFQGGDQTWHYSSAWLLSEGLLAPAVVGYVWPALLSPIALFAEPNILDALPPLVVLQVGILLPAALLCIYAVASRIGGRLLGFGAGAAWVALPYAAIPLFDARYHERYVDQFLPQALGLTAMSDFPSMVAMLIAATFAFRVMDSYRPADALVVGLAAGAAAGIKPANLLFVPALLLALALARRWRAIGFAAIGLAPALVTLAVWKQLGLGEIPAFAFPEAHLAAGPAPAVSLVGSVDRYVDLDWGQLKQNEDFIREYFWSVRLLEWLSLAGIVAMARRSVPAAALLAAWLVLFLVGKGTSQAASVQLGTFFRLLMPAFPAFFLLAVSMPLLLPRVGAAIAERGRSRPLGSRRTAWVTVGLLAAVTAGPLPVIVAAAPDREPRVVSDRQLNLRYAVSSELDVRAVPKEGGTLLMWRKPDTSAATFFRVMRAQPGQGTVCEQPPGAPAFCDLKMELRATLRGTRLFVPDPRAEGWLYRLGLAANATDDPSQGDIVLVSPEVVP